MKLDLLLPEHFQGRCMLAVHNHYTELDHKWVEPANIVVVIDFHKVLLRKVQGHFRQEEA